MGRGRAKAKQTKVARELKYSSGGIDIDRLRADLAANGTSGSPAGTSDHDSDHGADHDPYAPPHTSRYAGEAEDDVED